MKKRFIVTVAMVTAAFSISACGNTQASESNSVEYNSGSYKIGKDIPAGEYVFYAEQDELGVVTVKDGNAADSEELEFSTFYGNGFFTLDEGMYLNVTDANFYPVTEDLRVQYTENDAEYRVGIDIPAGEYNLESTEPGIFGSNVTVKSSSKVDELCIEMLEFFEGTYSVTVKDGQYIELDGCKIVE